MDNNYVSITLRIEMIKCFCFLTFFRSRFHIADGYFKLSLVYQILHTLSQETREPHTMLKVLQVTRRSMQKGKIVFGLKSGHGCLLNLSFPSGGMIFMTHENKRLYSKKHKYKQELFEYNDLIEDFTNSSPSNLETKLDLSRDMDFIKSFEGLNTEMDCNIKLVLDKFEDEKISILDKKQQIFEFLIYGLQFEEMGFSKQELYYTKYVAGFLKTKDDKIKSLRLLANLKEAEDGSTIDNFCFFAKKMVDYLDNLLQTQKTTSDFMFLVNNKYEVKSLLTVLEVFEQGLDFAPQLKNKGLRLAFELLFSYTTSDGERLVVDPINQLRYLETLKFLKKDKDVMNYLKKTKESINQKWWYERYLQELISSTESKEEYMAAFDREFKSHLKKFNNPECGKIPLVFFSAAFSNALKHKNMEHFDLFFDELEKMLHNDSNFKFSVETKNAESIDAFETEEQFFEYFNNNVQITLFHYLACFVDAIKSDPANVFVLRKLLKLLDQYKLNDVVSNAALRNLTNLVKMNESIEKTLKTDNTKLLLETMASVGEYITNENCMEIEPDSAHLLKGFFFSNCIKLLESEKYKTKIDELLVKTLKKESHL